MLAQFSLDGVKARLGGDEHLTAIGASDFTADSAHVTFQLSRRNPSHVRIVDISVQPNGRFTIDCFGALLPGTFHAPLVREATNIFPENLGTVLDQLVGLDAPRHRHS
jgi:hypothetical protein